MKLRLLPTLGALALAGGLFAASPAQAQTISGQTIYSGSLQNGWDNWSWAQTSPSKSPALTASSLSVAAGAWQAVYLHHSPLSGSKFKALSFWANGGAHGGQHLVVRALHFGEPQTPVMLTLAGKGWRQVVIPLTKLGVVNGTGVDGLWIQNATPAMLPVFYVDKISLSGPLSAAPPVVAPPAAPSGLTADPEWEPHCPTCGGMAMAHVILAWSAVPGPSSYTVYRDGAVLQDGLTSPTWTDMSVVSGKTYTYTVAASGPGGLGAQSAPVSATAPEPPDPVTAPVNLSVQGHWQGGQADMLAWSPVPGAVSYNVYQYGTQVATGLKAATFAIPPSLYYCGMTYTVSAVDAMGMESLPSAVAEAQGLQDPAQSPCWTPGLPVAPSQLTAVPEWNSGAPRVHLQWKGDGIDYTYNVYRDGQLARRGVWGLNFYDLAAAPGETHTYTVTGVNVPWTQAVESRQSAPVSATTSPAAPALTPGVVQITGVQANDDGAVISFAAVPGAVDYRVYDAAHPDSVKYSGGGLSIEMNGLDPVAGANLVVEAVDKLGPFQSMDGMVGPGAMQMDGMHEAINGQGDPSNIPIVLAASAPIPVTCAPRVLSGSQLFFDSFRNEQPLTALPCPAPVPGDNGGEYGCAGNYAASANDKWEIRNYAGDLTNTKAFFMGNHFMDTLYDGGTPGGNLPMHNNNASLVMMPKATADISGGHVLHVTFEVDSHFDSRRWCDLIVAPAGDTLMNPGKLDGGLWPTTSGNMFRWEIKNDFHLPEIFLGGAENLLVNVANGNNNDNEGVERDMLWDCTPGTNGTIQDLDKRHRFDLFLSQTHFCIMENGQVVKDADFPAGKTLPFTNCQVYFVHEVYHTSNDRPEQVSNGTQNSYWPNYRPFADERHWDNLGQSVLSDFP